MEVIRLSRRSEEAASRRHDVEKISGRRPSGGQTNTGDGDEDDDNEEAIVDVEEAPQAGVQRLEVVASTWSSWSLIAAYAGVYLMAYATSLEGQVTTNLTPYATSAFNSHSLISTVAVIQSIVLSVVKPPMSKIADVFGRLEAFSISVFLFTIGYIMEAGSNNVNTYAASAIFYSAGSTGVQILQQIFIADTSDLLNRALFSTIPDLPYLINVWIGPEIADYILEKLSWRWGYGIWSIILPVAFLPLALALYINQRRAARKGVLPPSPYAGKSFWTIVKSLWYELDLFGLTLLSAGVSLVLIPLTLAASSKHGWQSYSIVTLLVSGVVCLCIFPFWERNATLAPHAFLPRGLFKNGTVIAGVAIAFFYFMAFYLSVYPYFYSYLLIVQGQSVSSAGRITQTFTFTSTVTSIIISFVIMYTKRYKHLVTTGAVIYVIGLGCMIQYRRQGVSTWVLVACQVLLGIGGSLIHVPAQLGVQASASHAEVGAATAIFLTFLEIGGGVGAAISGAIWTNGVLPRLHQYLPDDLKHEAKAIYGSIAVASDMVRFPSGSPGREAIDRAYQETMSRILVVAIIVALPLIPLSLYMKNYRLDQMDHPVVGTVIGGRTEQADLAESEPFVGSSSRRSSNSSTKSRDTETAYQPRLYPVSSIHSVHRKHI
ncbi:hypothetical protein MBLNU457_g2396t3 [Dothideomycetes sp. NU457]